MLDSKLALALTACDVAKFESDVATGKSKADVKTKKRGRAIVEGGRGTAARSLAVLGAMLQFAVARTLPRRFPGDLYDAETEQAHG